MAILPIVTRELRVAARKRSTYWSRTVVAGIGLIILLPAYAESAPWLAGKAIFQTLTAVSLFFCVVAGAYVTADSLCWEKREGTLGLLFLTDLKGYDVVLGKLMASSLVPFFGFISMIPALSICLLLGGVTAGEFGRMVLVLISALFVSLAIGIMASAFNRHEGRAVGWALGLLLVIDVGLPWLDNCLPPPLKSVAMDQALLSVSITHAFAGAFDATYLQQPAEFWLSLVVAQLMGWGFLLVACFVTPHSWQDRPARTAPFSWTKRWQDWRYAKGPQFRAYRNRLLDTNPVIWLASRDRLKRWCVWFYLTLLSVGTVLGRTYYPDQFSGAYVFLTMVAHLILKWWVASEASQRLAQVRRDGSMELVMSTPLTVETYLQGQMGALRRQFFWPVIAMLVLDVLYLRLEYGRSGRPSAIIAFGIMSMVMLVVDVCTLAWTGMWLGLKHQSASRGSLTALARVLVLPSFVYVFFGMFGAGFSAAVAMYILIRGASNLVNYNSSVAGLTGNLRQMVTAWNQGGELTEKLATRFDDWIHPKS